MTVVLRSLPIRFSVHIRRLLEVFCILGLVYLVAKQLRTHHSVEVPDIAKRLASLKHKRPAAEIIPKKIWQTWHTPAILLAEEEKTHARTWQEYNQDFQYELITDKAAETFVQQQFGEGDLFRDVYTNLTDAILRADFLRYLLLLAEGGVYADVDVECREPIDTWIPTQFQGKVGVVLGVETDRKRVENDVKLYLDHREYIWGIANWSFMSKRDHPFLRLVAETVTNNLLEVARTQDRTLATMSLSYKEVIDSTGPRAFTEAFLAYASRVTGSKFTYEDATMLDEPKLINDILLLPIRAFSASEADRDGGEGARAYGYPTLIYHWSAGTWKKTHFQKLEAT